MQPAMTNRDRFFATVRGEETDRHPVWLKMANPTWQKPQPAPVRDLDEGALLRSCGCDLIVGNHLGGHVTRPHVRVETERTAERIHHRWTTPDGVLEHSLGREPRTGSTHPLSYPVTTTADLAAFRWWLEDTSYTVLEEERGRHAARQQQAVADDAVTCSYLPHSTLMMLVETICGPENTVYLLMDAPELFAEVIALMHADRLRQLEALLPHLAADTCWLIENTSTTLISPEMFRRFSAPGLREYGALIQDRGVICVHHMCGTLNALLEDIDALPAQVNEAYTTAPLGDVSLAAGRTRMPSKALFGGTNATLWLREADAIIDEVRRDLAACPDRRKIILSSAGVLPPCVDLEKARTVVAAFKAL